MRNLKRRNSNTLAIHDLKNAGLEVFIPMTQMIMTIGDRRQRRDVLAIYADTSALERDLGFRPTTSLRNGIRRFVKWYKEFYKRTKFN